jgi:hypothetical protein
MTKAKKSNKKGVVRVDLNEPITDKHYENIMEEYFHLYEEEFGIDALEDTYKHFTDDEQVERYARNIFFWRKLKPDGKDVMDNPTTEKMARYTVVSNAEHNMIERVYERFKGRKHVIQRINDRLTQLQEEYEIELKVKQFMKDNPYPTYTKVRSLMKGNIDILAEYGEYNHEVLSAMWDNFFVNGFIKNIGSRIGHRGGFTAMQSNFETVMIVTRHLIKSNKNLPSDLVNEIQSTIYNDLNTKWDGIAGWLA